MSTTSAVRPAEAHESVGTGPVRSHRGRRALAVVLGGALLLAWVAYLYSLGWRAFASHSDSSNALLAGRDLVGGNVFLRHWELPAAHYWPFELALYGLASRVLGLGPGALHVVPTVVGAAVVLTGAGLARAGRPGFPGWVAAGVVMVLLGLPSPFLTYVLYQGPWHVGTALWCLAAFALLGHRFGTGRWWLGVAALWAAVTGDALAVALGVGPVLAGGLLATLRGRAWGPLRAAAAAGGVATAGAVLTRLALDQLGGFAVVGQPLAPRGAWVGNLGAVPRVMTTLLGWHHENLEGNYRELHLLGVEAVTVGLAATAIAVLWRTVPRRGARPGDGRSHWLDDVLLAGFVGGVAATAAIMVPGAGLAGGRYVAAPVVFGVILAGRRVGQGVARLPPRAARWVAVVGLAAAAFHLVASSSYLSDPLHPHKERDLAAWLETQDLRTGFGSYWVASDVVVQSRGRVVVRPVVAVGGKLHGLGFYAPRRWFQASGPTGSAPHFLVHDRDLPWGGVEAGVAEATFGPPARTLRYRSYDVLVWEHDLAPQLGPPWRQGDPL